MIVTFSPEGQEPQTRDFRPRKLMVQQVAVIERTYGKLLGRLGRMPMAEFEGALVAETPEARQVLVWFLFEPTKAVEEVDFVWDDLDVTFTKEDWRRAKDRAVVFITEPEARAEALAEFDARIAEAPDGAEGKAPSADSSNSTGSPSSKPSAFSPASSRNGSRSKR
jgi:hypothetical protein